VRDQITNRKDFARWIVSLIIGVLTALIGCFIAISIESIADIKYDYLKQGMSHFLSPTFLSIPFYF
jgi:chloride channel 7